jgi:predicted histone-like DNA-binding protein
VSLTFDNFVGTNLFYHPNESIFMAVSFKMVPKKNNLASPPETKYYPCAVHDGEVNLNQLAAIVASRSTVSRVDCSGVIIGLTQAIGEALAAGRIVKIDDLGTFQITLQGLPADSPDDLGKSNIKGAKIIYKPSGNMKEAMEQLTYKRIR